MIRSNQTALSIQHIQWAIQQQIRQQICIVWLYCAWIYTVRKLKIWIIKIDFFFLFLKLNTNFNASCLLFGLMKTLFFRGWLFWSSFNHQRELHRCGGWRVCGLRFCSIKITNNWNQNNWLLKKQWQVEPAPPTLIKLQRIWGNKTFMKSLQHYIMQCQLTVLWHSVLCESCNT